MLERAERWRAMLDSGEVRSRAETGRREGLSGARVGQVLKLLDMPAELRRAISNLRPETPARVLTERRLRYCRNVGASLDCLTAIAHRVD
jgi:hypothetical protein